MWKPSKLQLLSLLMAVSFILPVVAASAPTSTGNVNFNDSGATTVTYERFHVVGGDNSYLFLSAPLVASNGAVTVSGGGTYNFTGARLTSVSNPAQSFGVRLQGGNATIKTIASDHIEFITSENAAMTLSMYYIMPAGSAYAIPPSVVLAGGTTVIQQAQYGTSASCNAPCVFNNLASKDLVVSLPSSSTLDVYYVVYGTGTSCGIPLYPSCGSGAPTSSGPVVGGGGGAVGIGNAINQVAQNLPALTPAFVGNPALNVIAEIVTVGVAAFILLAAAFSRRGRSPGGGRTRQPSVSVGRTRSPRVNVGASKSLGVFNWGTKRREYDLP